MLPVGTWVDSHLCGVPTATSLHCSQKNFWVDAKYQAFSDYPIKLPALDT